ncbi:ABC transporter [Labedella phragmitis]|uniref:ABC transporter n=1 Tax=Labedella phragmitis TaxID=2498849 RepID=A0A444PTM3_9MICO|nr:ABC transporter [Labedella phragmitis]RWZ51211.1 ABC transporter [Labedella phragmitis]
MIHRSSTLALLTAGLVALTACSGAPSDTDTTASSTGDGHGRVEGASEVAEPRLGLTTVGPDGVVQHLDLLDGSVADIAEVPRPRALTTDGRYLFSEGDAGITIVDSGRWTWDHVDHFHYYRAEPRTVGAIAGTGPVAVATTNSSTTGGTGLFFAGSGDAVLLDTEALSHGELVDRFRLSVEPHDGLVVPVGSFALVSDPQSGGGSLSAYTADGDPVTDRTIECAAPAGTITTRVGAVVGCRDGAVLATAEDGSLSLEKIAYPADATAPPATAFAAREGRPTVAALAGDQGIWLLDTRERSWTLLPAPAPLVSVTAVDDEDGHLLALGADGRVLVLDAATGAVRAETVPLLDATLRSPEALAGVELIADQQRAYVNAPLERKLYEIDFADGARIARTFETAADASFLAETGR